MNVVKKQSRINWAAGACPLQVDTGEYHVQDFHVCDWLFSYDPLKFPVILASSLRYNIILANFLKSQWKITYIFRHTPLLTKQKSFDSYPVDTGRKLNVHKTFRRRPGRLLNVLCTFNLRPVSTGYLIYTFRFFITGTMSSKSL